MFGSTAKEDGAISSITSFDTYLLSNAQHVNGFIVEHITSVQYTPSRRCNISVEHERTNGKTCMVCFYQMCYVVGACRMWVDLMGM